MQFEGDDKVLALRGIERAGSEAASEDGAMNEIIGMITRDGSLVPYSPTDTGLEQATNVRMVRVHHTSTCDNTIVVRTGKYSGSQVTFTPTDTFIKNGYCTGVIYKAPAAATTAETTTETTDGTMAVTEEELTVLYGEVEEIVFIGNRMIIKSDAGIESFLWKGGSYQKETDVSAEMTGTRYVLPSVEFKVRAGILDGNKKTHRFAQLVRVEVPYVTTTTPTDTKHAHVNAEAEYARSTTNMGSDALALLQSIRHNGGITGYVMVAAAYHLKNSDSTSGQKYVAASDIVLMGAPRIFQKENKVRKANGTGMLNLPSPTMKPYMVDVLNYQSTFSANFHRGIEADIEAGTITTSVLAVLTGGLAGGFAGLGYADSTATRARKKIGGISSQEASYAQLRKAEDATESTEDKTGKSYREIQYNDDADLIGSTSTQVRIAGEYVVQGYYTQDGQEGNNKRNCMWIPNSTTERIDCPSLFGCKYGTYYHAKETGSSSDSDDNHYGYRITRGTGNILSMRINSDIATAYKDEIDELVIFMSPIISPYALASDGESISMQSTLLQGYNSFRGFFFDEKPCDGNYKRQHSACGGGFMPEMLSDEALRKKIEETDTLYRIHTIPFAEIKEGGWVDINLGNGRLDESYLVEQEALQLSALQKVEVLNGHIFGYNERLHVYNYAKSLVQRVNYQTLAYYGSEAEGQYKADAQDWFAGYAGTVYHYAIVVTDKNGSVVVSKFDSIYSTINPMISYPDIEADSIRVVKYYEANGRYFVGEKSYTAKALGNISAYHLDSELKPICIPVSPITSLKEYNAAVPKEQIQDDSQTYGKNEIRVSGTGTLVFENTNNYKVGNGEIIGLARMVMGLSQDNFGKFPLVIFSTDGIYTLAVDSTGESVYTYQTPVSRVICTNKNSICELDGAVAFATESGLMMLTESGVKAFAHHVNGTPRNIPTDSNGLTMYGKAIDHENIVELSGDISEEDFVDYVQAQNTYIRFLHAINSVLIYNTDKSYSYVIDLTTFVCTKLEQHVMLDDNDFPKQSFYLQPEKSIRVSIEKKVLGNWETQYYDIVKAAEDYDTGSALREYLTEGIDNAIMAKAQEVQTQIDEVNERIAEIDEMLSLISDPDGEYTEYNTSANTEELKNSRAEAEAKLSTLQSEYNRYLYIQGVFDGDTPNDGDTVEGLLSSIGIKTVDEQLEAEANGEVDYTEQRETLRSAWQERMLGTVDESRFGFDVGTTYLSKTASGTWQYEGRDAVSDDAGLIEKGLTPATSMTDRRYVIYIENLHHTSVRFDYFTSADASQCLLQTRAIKLETSMLKAAYRVVLRGAFEKTNDISMVSREGNVFEVTNEALLLSKLRKGKVVLEYKEPLKDGDWRWWDSNGQEAKLSDYGVALQGTMKAQNGTQQEDLLTMQIAEHYAGLYVFGSLDGEHWIAIGGEEKLVSYNRFHDIGCRTHRVSMRYLMVVFAGYLNTDCHIDGLEITKETRYNNKLK